MNKRRVIGIAAAALAATMLIGAASIAVAAPAEDAGTTTGQSLGLRLGGVIRDAGARMVDIVADLTGLDVSDIHDRRVDGESLATIAESEGVDPNDVVSEALDARAAILDEKVADGTLTEEQAAEVLANMQDRLSERIDSTQVGGFGRGGGRGAGAGMGNGGRGMGGGMGGNGGQCVLDTDS